MTTAVEQIASDAIEHLKSASPEILLVAGMIALGYLLRIISVFPNKYIPAVVVFIPAVLYPMLCRCTPEDYQKMYYPLVRLAVIGFGLGFVSWALHGMVIKRFEKWLPKGNTEIIRKDDK